MLLILQKTALGLVTLKFTQFRKSGEIQFMNLKNIFVFYNLLRIIDKKNNS